MLGFRWDRVGFMLCACCVCLAAGPSLAQEVKLGPPPSWYRPMSVSLGDAPAEQLVAEPTYSSKPLYAKLVLGDGPDNVFVVAIDLPPDWAEFKKIYDGAGGVVQMSDVPARVYLDCNNDEDLTNDGNGLWGSISPDPSKPNAFIIRAAFTCCVAYADGTVVDWPMNLYMFPGRGSIAAPGQAARDYGRTLFYYRGASFEATLLVEGQEIKAWFYDENSDALIRAQDGDHVAIDLNRDGRIEPGTRSPELFKLDAAFLIDGKAYELSEVPVRGGGAKVVASQKPAEERPYLSPGHPAPDFTATTVSGQTFKLSDLRGKVVLLDFWATWCGPCVKEMPNVVQVWNANKDRGLVIIGISLDYDKPNLPAVKQVQDFAAKNGMDWMLVAEGKFWDSPIGQQYQVSAIPCTFLIDREGIIRGTGLRGESLGREVEKLLGGGSANGQ